MMHTIIGDIMYYLNCFFIYSILGHILETVTALITGNGFKSGILNGWWTPVYGIGAVTILFVSECHYVFCCRNSIINVRSIRRRFNRKIIWYSILGLFTAKVSYRTLYIAWDDTCLGSSKCNIYIYYSSIIKRINQNNSCLVNYFTYYFIFDGLYKNFYR